MIASLFNNASCNNDLMRDEKVIKAHISMMEKNSNQ